MQQGLSLLIDELIDSQIICLRVQVLIESLEVACCSLLNYFESRPGHLAQLDCIALFLLQPLQLQGLMTAPFEKGTLNLNFILIAARMAGSQVLPALVVNGHLVVERVLAKLNFVCALRRVDHIMVVILVLEVLPFVILCLLRAHFIYSDLKLLLFIAFIIFKH